VNCERCGKHPGEIRYTEVVGGSTRKMMICEACADELGFGEEEGTRGPVAAGEPTGPWPVPGAVVFAAAGMPSDPEFLRLRCPGCGVRGAELRNASLLGCARCYATFATWLVPILERLHGATRHEGRLPGANPRPPAAGEGSA
jgi:protein arginine kinase activator